MGANTHGTDRGGISNCYSSARVSGEIDVGGLVGDNSDLYDRQGTVVNSFWDIEASGVPGSDGGEGLTTHEIKSASTFYNAGWDFINVWGIGENQTYPYLRKYSAADINQDESVNFGDLAILAENWLSGVAR